MKWYKHIVFFLVMTVAAWSATDITDGCDLPENPLGGGYLHLTSDGAVLYKSPEAIAGWQFNIEGATANSASGGDTQAAGLIINASGDMVLAFSLSGGSIPAGCGTLVELDLNGEATGLINLVFSDTNAQAIYFEYYDGSSDDVAGCMDMNACNYNAEATEDDG
ncbi:uncharacterized protein METZ01_LOCUS467252, partial [marine metagenome]